MPPFIYQLISATCFGISNAYWKKIEKAGFDFTEAIFYRAIVGVLMIILLLTCLSSSGVLQPLIFINNSFYQNYHWLYSVLICIFCSFGLVCYVSSLKFKIVGVAVSLSSINIFGIATATIFFHEAFLPKHTISFLIAIIGILFVSIKPSIQKKHSSDFKPILLPIAASMFWGIGYTLFKIPLQWVGALSLSLFIETTVLFVAFFLLVKNKKIATLNFRKAYFTTPVFYVSGLLLVLGSVFINIALSKLSMATVNILGLFTFPVSILAAYLFNKEKPTLKEWLGISFIILSILYLCVAT